MYHLPTCLQARDFIHQNPASALAPLPLVLPLTPAPSLLPTPVPSGRWVPGVCSVGRRIAMCEKAECT